MRYHTATIAAPINPVSAPSPRTECSRLLMLGSARVMSEVPKPAYRLSLPPALVMCSGSPALGRASASAVVAGASTQELLEGVDAGTVAITPLNPNTIGPNQGQAQRLYIGSHVCRVEQRAPADLLDAASARTG